MKFVVLDFESHFSDDYTLSKMSTEAYIRDPRFEAHGAAIKFSPDLPARWWNGTELPQLFADIDWSDIFLISHHAQFDHLILSHHYNVRPKMAGCTLAMARMLIGNHVSVSLDSVRKHFGIPSKTTPYHLFRGKHWHELHPAVQQQIAEGACDEAESIWNVFALFAQGYLGPNRKAPTPFPAEELDTIDSVLKMFTEPVLRADVELLAKVWTDEEKRKGDMLQTLNVNEAQLQSSESFASLLRESGVEPEMKEGKVSEKTGKSKQNYAFAKTDQFMRDLLEDDDDRVRTLAEARLGVKSTLMQTRAETLGWMAHRGSLPVYLNFAGAGTLRVSGGDGANWLNFKRGSAIRRSILAPEGYLLAPVDSSQIECRVLHYLAGGPGEPVIQKFRNHEDPYVDLASLFYRETIYKPKADDPRRAEMEAKRGMGKQGRLMCLGPDTLVITNRGIKPITTVALGDRLWDGYEWVVHQGLISQGVQNVVKNAGVFSTPDHPVLCGTIWLPAASLQNENILCLALASASANCASLVTNWELKAVCGLLSFVVPAALRNIPFSQTICSLAARRAVTLVRKKQPVTGLKNTTATPIFAQTKHIVGGFLAGLVRLLPGAKSRPREIITPMAAAASASTPLGLEIDAVSSDILSHFRDGTIQFSTSTVETTNVVTFPEIFGSLRACKTTQTDVASKISNIQSPVYDIAFAGPRNRFTILSDRGPLIVHNCGYGAAGLQFQRTAKNGLYGPPVDISIEDANAFVALYRETNSSICGKNTGYWAQAGRMLSRLAGGEPCDWGPLHVEDHRIYLPNGAPLIYDTLEYFKPPPEEAGNYREFEREGFWRVRTRHGWKTMWGSKLVQNVCEAVSRVIVSQAMLRIKAMGYRTLNWPYDELLLLIPRDGHEDKHVERCLIEMKRTPDWLPGLPLDAETSLAERYSK